MPRILASTDTDIENTDTFGNYLVHGIDEIVLPEAISWMPQTWGWWLVMALLLTWLVWAGYRYGRKWWRNRYRRAALQHLSQLRQLSDPAKAVGALPELLKMTALHAYKRETVASLSGQTWLRFLTEQYDGPPFDSQLGELLTDVAYKPASQWQCDQQTAVQLIDQCQIWIERHRQEEAA